MLPQLDKRNEGHDKNYTRKATNMRVQYTVFARIDAVLLQRDL